MVQWVTIAIFLNFQLIPSTSLSVTAPLIISLIVVLKMSDTERGDTVNQQQHNEQLRNKLWVSRFLKVTLDILVTDLTSRTFCLLREGKHCSILGVLA